MRALLLTHERDVRIAAATTENSAGTPWNPRSPLGFHENAAAMPAVPDTCREPGTFTNPVDPTIQEALGIELEAGLGAFLGLRAALVINVGFAVAGLIGYEIWSLIAHWR